MNSCSLSLATKPSQVEIILILHKVMRVGEHYAFGRQPITSCTTHLLIVLLHSLACPPMDHTADIRLIYTHSKGNSCTDYRNFTNEKCCVCIRTMTKGKTSMVRLHVGRCKLGGIVEINRIVATMNRVLLDELMGKSLSDLCGNVLHLFFCRAVNNCTFSRNYRSGVIVDPTLFHNSFRHFLDHFFKSSQGPVPGLPTNDNLEIWTIE
mmetsp:Transcript_8488/g.18995  ORF Transcript_8488/g.18995 Transcript_8488/m.18995 type:complete len:208 (+) Transcript_8488:1725-2348(+)